MKPEKFVSILLVTILLSCDKKKPTDHSTKKANQKIGEVSFETNQYIMNCTFDIDIYVDQKKIGSYNYKRDISESETMTKLKLEKKLESGVHTYEVKVLSHNGEPGKTIHGKFIITENKKSEVFIDFKN